MSGRDAGATHTARSFGSRRERVILLGSRRQIQPCHLERGKELACEFPPGVERSAAGRHHCGGIAWHEQSLVDPGREQVPRLALAAQARLKTALGMTVDTQTLPLAVTDFVVRESLQTQSNSVNYESACTWDICSLSVVNEMVSRSLSRRSRGPWEEKITSTKSTSGSCA